MSLLTAFHNLKGPLKVGIDYISRAVITKHVEHFMTHEGKHYISAHFFDAVASGSNAVVLFRTPTDKYTHMVFSADSSAGAKITIYENSTRTYVAGNILSAINRNRPSSNVSGFQQICHTPAGVETGDVMVPTQKMGTSGNPNATAPGENRDANEYVLDLDTVYAVEVESEANGTDINIGLDWYETGPTT